MEKLKIIGWTSFDEDYPMTVDTQDVFMEKVKLVENEIIENGYFFSGEEHQNSPTGMPVFNDGSVFRASMRAWGNIMANARSKKDDEEYSYMDFYMTLDNSIMPPATQITVAPKNVDKQILGCTVGADQALIEQSINFNMPLFTTDKVIENIYNNQKK